MRVYTVSLSSSGVISVAVSPLAVEVDVAVAVAGVEGVEEEKGDLTLPRRRPMVGFRVFFPSPMPKEICSEASPSSAPVYWGYAWAQPQVSQVTSI